MPNDTKTAGQIAFEAYGAAVGGKTYDHKPIPQWSEIKPEIQQGWELAAKAAIADSWLSVALDEPATVDEEIWNTLVATWRKLKAARPDDRSERARRYAVTITEYEKALSYFNTMVHEGLDA